MRLLLYVVVGVIILTLLRSVLEAVGKVFAGGASPTPASSGAARGQAAPQSLKKDPVCGTFVAPSTWAHRDFSPHTFWVLCGPRANNRPTYIKRTITASRVLGRRALRDRLANPPDLRFQNGCQKDIECPGSYGLGPKRRIERIGKHHDRRMLGNG